MTGRTDMGARRRIAVVTGTRAEYGLLRPVMERIRASARLDLRVVATGAHLLPSQGLTVEDLRRDGFAPDVEVDMVVGGDSRRAVAKSIGLGVIGLTDAFVALAPDAVLILGDRYEALAAATAALALGVPIAHLEGGHVTEGAFDDSIRHAITKMAQIHFTAADRYGARLVQMGERPESVHVVGSTGVDNVLAVPRMSRAELEADLGIPLTAPVLVVTHHPATAGVADALAEVEALVGAIEDAGAGAVIVTGANADPEGEAINARFRRFVEAAPERRRFVQSLGMRRYISLVGEADVVVGNSSSGVIEAPSLGAPTVNIGERQTGRLKAASVLDCPPERAAIVAAIRKALSPELRAAAATGKSPFGDGHAADRIVAILETAPLRPRAAKPFHDLDEAMPPANLQPEPTASQR